MNVVYLSLCPKHTKIFSLSSRFVEINTSGLRKIDSIFTVLKVKSHLLGSKALKKKVNMVV